MRPSRHILKINRLAILTGSQGSVSGIVTKAVFHTHNDPFSLLVADRLLPTDTAYHKFVKTTPNPNATKNNKGELVGLLLEPDDVVDVDVAAARDADGYVDDDMTEVAPGASVVWRSCRLRSVSFKASTSTSFTSVILNNVSLR
jgi:hypothetical protein